MFPSRGAASSLTCSRRHTEDTFSAEQKVLPVYVFSAVAQCMSLPHQTPRHTSRCTLAHVLLTSSNSSGTNLKRHSNGNSHTYLVSPSSGPSSLRCCCARRRCCRSTRSSSGRPRPSASRLATLHCCRQTTASSGVAGFVRPSPAKATQNTLRGRVATRRRCKPAARSLALTSSRSDVPRPPML